MYSDDKSAAEAKYNIGMRMVELCRVRQEPCQ